MLPRHHLNITGLEMASILSWDVHILYTVDQVPFLRGFIWTIFFPLHYTISHFGESTVLLSIWFSCLLSRPPGSDHTNGIVINKAWIYVTHKLIHRWTLKILQRVYMVTWRCVCLLSAQVIDDHATFFWSLSNLARIFLSGRMLCLVCMHSSILKSVFIFIFI